MFKDVLKAVNRIKGEVFRETDKHVDTFSRNVSSGIRSGISGLASNARNQAMDSVKDAVVGKAKSYTDYLFQVDKVIHEEDARKLGITARELISTPKSELSARLGVPEEQLTPYSESEESPAAITVGKLKDINERTEKEAKARREQAEYLRMELSEFDKLTLQEQADKLGMTLESLREERALIF
ncbi:hypothetical protein J2S70_001291 [Trueperella bonasi]|uniref:Uncharacterized protein n=1 Tax=Trueperella bonasi TaxID=312286 RepID=A0ABT9NH23_9ACTO|nr:hypothetical protein [Trueperella bonasi]MDP9806709.1 hypothetical protein [Trueperella bonasi]